MKRDEFLAYCETLSKEELHRRALEDRARGVPASPEALATFRSLDTAARVEEHWLYTSCTPDPAGTHVYVVTPEKRPAEALPVVVNVHGGGWCKSHSDRDIYLCRRLAVSLPCLVVDVDYVLAPEYPYPNALEEIEALLNTLPELLPEWGGDSERVILFGQSAGGNLLGGVSQRKRLNGRLNVRGQILAYAPCDNYSNHFGDAELDLRDMSTELYGFYYNQNMEERKHSDVSLNFASAEELLGVPPTDIITAGKDNLCDEGRRYYDLLVSRNISATYRCFEDSRHGFVVNLVDQWKDAEDYVLQCIRKHLQKI